MRNKLIELASGVGAVLIPSLVLASEMDHSTHNMASETASASGGMDTLLLMLMTLGVFFLFASLYFIYIATRIYGGIIGNGLKIASLGIVGVSINEIDNLLHMHFNIDIAETIFNNTAAEMLFHHILNVLIFFAFTYGFFKLSGIISTAAKTETDTASAKK